MHEKIKEIKERMIDRIHNAIVVNDTIKTPENIMYLSKAIYYLEDDMNTGYGKEHREHMEMM